MIVGPLQHPETETRAPKISQSVKLGAAQKWMGQDSSISKAERTLLFKKHRLLQSMNSETYLYLSKLEQSREALNDCRLLG